MKFTQTQQQRIIELDLTGEYVAKTEEEFASLEEREAAFREIDQELIKENQRRLVEFIDHKHQSSLRKNEFKIVDSLTQLGFSEVITPIKLAQGHLKKMGINEEHPLWKQVYWVDDGKYCLRPMLAPNLYYLLGYFEGSLSKPVKIFEIGPCFRKESRGSKHLSEFTMLNIVELGPTGDPCVRLKSLIEELMSTLELDYYLEEEESAVYNKTIDVMVDGVEVGSAAIGPHSLDRAWNISQPWVGVGFGLERLVMCKEDLNNIKRVGRSLIYQDGARLNI
ncbi:pyrrolysine--tRNA(Pyl) ligase large subunit [Natroniella acetigena]|uniref:pyrrolysine--tRNA(Pyl) ligase large subunit n=1 Tax=Natroniella acetigena TaxID=52004 RepID=UPI00200AC4EB|nr:pyrrolysine--tRNA(Pyl) ligase large subunit [Natroniella acetigena]MCK8827439.1 pyrrolysine--tRNA(Pyl) ligase large subunit [Natroniella acetigena]